jgi:PAS domain S-box-containing protein
MKKLSGDVLAKAWGKAMGTDRKQFDMFFDRMLDGFAYHKIVVDKSGKPVDYVFLEVNHAFEKMTGLKRERILGKKVTEILPGIEKDPADWIGVYGRVALTGVPAQFESHAESLGKWYKVVAYCPEKEHFVALFEDITERKNIEDSRQTAFHRLDGILSSMHGAILLVSADGHVEFANQSFCDYFRLKESPADLKGLSSGEMLEKLKNVYANPDLEIARIKEMITAEKAVTGEEVVLEGGRTCIRDFIPLYIEGKLSSRLWHHMDITDLKKAEEALRLSEEKANALVKYAPTGIYEIDYRNPKFKNVNDAMCKILGYTREELLAMSPADVLDADSRLRFKERVMNLLAGKKIDDTVEFKVKTKDERTIYAVLNVMFTYKDGKPDSAVVIAHDVTERKKAEEALRESEERYRHLVQYAPTAIYEIDFVGPRFTSVNDAMCVMSGYTREELLNKNPLDGLDRESQILFKQRLGKALAGEKIDENVEYKAITKNGGQFWVTLNMKFITKNGKIYGAQVVAHDVTERKKAEEALRQINEELEVRIHERTKEVLSERQRLYSILETLPAYVILLDKDYHVPFANKVFRESFGESLGRRCYDYLFKLDSPCENCETYKVLKTNKPHHWEWTGPNGYDYDIYDFPFVEADGSTLILEMGIDITERKKAEASAQESAKKLKDAERLAAIGATAGMVGHDIRNPLQAITSDVYLAKAELASIPEGEEKKNALESLDEIENNVIYINKIVADLQDYARTLKPVAKETNLTKLVEELLKKNGVPKNVKVQVKLQKDAGTVMADSDILKRVLGNLVTNAVQAMPEGGKLVIQAFKDGADSVITVEDSGVGIPEEARSKLFTPLFTTKSKGQGFGLAVVKRMTEALGGTVAFESAVGKGTKFIIRLPQASQAANGSSNKNGQPK